MRGALDLALVALVIGAAWTRTPAGHLAASTVAWVRGVEAPTGSLLGFYDEVPSAVLARWLADDAPLLVAVDPAATGFPEPYRSSAARVLDRGIPELAIAELHRRDLHDPLELLDALWDGDPERTLEIFTVGPELRARAVDRARAAGSADPERFEEHARFLPSRARREATYLLSGVLALGTLADMLWPIEAPHRVTSPYGMRTHPIHGGWRFHNGVDLAVPIGTPVRAPREGRVARVKEDARNGRYVTLEHDGGVKTTFCHLDSVDVVEGQRIGRGEVFAASGNTGGSTGPHLHYIVRVSNETVDPQVLRPPAPPAERAGADPDPADDRG